MSLSLPKIQRGQPVEHSTDRLVGQLEALRSSSRNFRGGTVLGEDGSAACFFEASDDDLKGSTSRAIPCLDQTKRRMRALS
jgi:hypothetical protein